MTNLNLVFNKLYYVKLGDDGFEKSVKDWNAVIENTRFEKSDYKNPRFPCTSFELQVNYPGLLIGTGNPHGTGTVDDEVNAGFSFDYVTGQPYIPASSVKGMLRSCFRLYPDIVKTFADCDEVSELEKEIFVSSKDVFFDAVIKSGDRDKKILGFDFITPHKSATEEPVPIRILKLLPGVNLEFRFALTNGILNADKKKKLFEALLSTFGIGAKTNVGYGVMENANQTICPSCGKQNYKYTKDGKLNRAWEQNLCFCCHKPLN